LGGTLSHVYSHALKGYSLTLPSAAVAQLAADPRVDYVEADGVMKADTTQSGATWGSTGSTSARFRSPARTRTSRRGAA